MHCDLRVFTLQCVTAAALDSPEPANSSQVREHLSTSYKLQHHVQVGVILSIDTVHNATFEFEHQK